PRRELAGAPRRVARASGDPAVVATRRSPAWLRTAGAMLAVVAIAAIVVSRRQSAVAPATQYIPLTNFADSATSPALSPDGRVLAFIRGPSTFFGPGQIWIKPLPDGEPVQLTDDPTLKMGPRFTP